jgi:hypothetical protein
MLAYPADAADAVRRFERAWNCDEAAERLTILKSCCLADAEFAQAQGTTRGIEALNASIGRFLRTYPRARVMFGSPAVSQGNVSVAWRTDFNDGATQALSGTDTITLNSDMRIVKVVSVDDRPTGA